MADAIPSLLPLFRFTLVPSTAMMALSAISLARVSAASTADPVDTRLTNPLSLASAAPKNRPVKQISRTQESLRQIRGRKYNEPRSAQIPILTSLTENLDVEQATRMSQAEAMSTPNPTQSPFIAHITGRGNFEMAIIGVCSESMIVLSSLARFPGETPSGGANIAATEGHVRSSPDEKERSPDPVIMTTFTESSLDGRSTVNRDCSSIRVSRLMALSRSGR